MQLRAAILLALFSILFWACRNNSLSENKRVKKFFSNSEIQELYIILDFFDTKICEIDGAANDKKEECLRKFLARLEAQVASNSLDLKIPFDEQKLFYTQLNSGTFEHIWQLDTVFFEDGSKAELLHASNFTTYAAFLKELGKESIAIKRYSDGFDNSNALTSAALVQYLLLNYEKFDLSDERVRLLFAIHYLTMNDKHLRDRETYNKNIEERIRVKR